MKDTAATPALWGAGGVGASAGAVSGVALMPSLAAGAAARGLTQQHRSAEDALTTTRSLVRRVRRLYVTSLSISIR